jgi:Xaa-Pro aminopeptidase
MSRRQRLNAALEQRGCEVFIATQRPNQLYLVPHADPVSGLPPIPFLLFHGEDTVAFPGPMFYFACRDQLPACEIAQTEVGDPDALTRLGEWLASRKIRRALFDSLSPSHAAFLQQQAHQTTCMEDSLFGPILRRAKEPAELEILRAAATISDLGISAAFAAARPGVSNREIAAEASYVMLKAGCEEVGMQVASGPGAAYMGTGNWTFDPRRTLQEGDMLVVDMGILYKGYLGDQTRTAIVGEGAPLQREILQTIQEAYRATRDAMRPGARAADLYQITVEMLAAKGWRKYFPHHISHGLGLGGDLPRIAAGREDILQAGDALSCEPGVYIPGAGGARFENMLYITDTGAEELTRSPVDPVVGI